MAASRYHILPEETRPSMDTIPDDDVQEDERLLGPVSEINSSSGHESITSPPRKEMIFTYHPTFLLRIANTAVLSASLGVFSANLTDRSTPALVFVSIALARNTLVQLYYIIGRWVTFQIEIVGAETNANEGIRNQKKQNWLQRNWFQIVVDFAIVLGLIITTATASKGNYYNRVPGAAIVLTWIAVALHTLCSLDLGNPRKFPVRGRIIVDRSGQTEPETTGAITLLDNEYDVEAEAAAPAPTAISQKSLYA